MKAFGLNYMSTEHVFNDDPTHLVRMETKVSSVQSVQRFDWQVPFPLAERMGQGTASSGGEISETFKEVYARAI